MIYIISKSFLTKENLSRSFIDVTFFISYFLSNRLSTIEQIIGISWSFTGRKLKKTTVETHTFTALIPNQTISNEASHTLKTKKLTLNIWH